MTATQQQMLTMHHPSFREGYQAGRRYAFEKQVTLTDLQLVENLLSTIQENTASPRDESVYYTIGGFIGQMSAVVIPCQPTEDNTQAIRETFLTKLRRGSGASGEAMIEKVQQLWALQDLLAQTMGTDDFEQMLRNGVEEVL